jgi:large subunit ribosomal protein L6
MSRLGFKPISLPSGATVTINGCVATVKGAKGEVSVLIPSDVSVEVKDGKATVKIIAKEDEARQGNREPWHARLPLNLKNALHGVTVGWKKELEIAGTGYRCFDEGQSGQHVPWLIPTILINPIGAVHQDQRALMKRTSRRRRDKQQVGQTAALIYDSHRPDVYGNKGVHYQGSAYDQEGGQTRCCDHCGGAAGAAPALRNKEDEPHDSKRIAQ